MRIAYLTGEYPRATDTFIQREVFGLREQGVDVHTFSVRRTGDEHIVGPEQQSERERTFCLLPINPFKLLWIHCKLLLQAPARYGRSLQLTWKTRQHGLKGTLYQLFYFAEAGILAQEIQQRQIQHLHNHIVNPSGTVAMLAAELGDFTFSFTLHGPYEFFEPYRWCLEQKIERASFVSCISHFCRSQAMLFSPMEKWNRLHIIHCGVDPLVYQPVVHQGIGKRLLFVGRLAAAKGLPILFEAMLTLKLTHPDVVLTVVGDGRERPELEEIVARLELSEHVKFVGYQSQEEVKEYLRQSDLFVLPSFAEGVPVVLMEAMAMGVPVVATQIAGISELVEHNISGCLGPPGDIKTLADAIRGLLNNCELRTQLGIAGRAKVEREFNIHQEVSRLHHILASALQKTES
jgi:colanic acid/amylovoran biosynthesis glycosyltransferase